MYKIQLWKTIFASWLFFLIPELIFPGSLAQSKGDSPAIASCHCEHCAGPSTGYSKEPCECEPGFIWLKDKCIEELKGAAAEMKLISDILNKYDSRVRPVKAFEDAIYLNFTLTLQQIVDLDEKNQLLTTSMFMDWAWEDVLLRWDPAKYGNITNIRVPAKYVWTPDILIYNSAASSFDQMLKTNVIVYSSGFVYWLPPGLFQTTCDVDIRYFPFDEQRCKIKFGTWTHDLAMIDLLLTNESAATDSYTKSGEWELIAMKGVRTQRTYKCCGDQLFVDITYTIHIKRRVFYYGFNLILPCVLICALTILVFLLPADSGERIGLCITILLALVVFLQIVADTLPPTDVIPLLGKYFACSIIMVAGSVFATVVSLNFHHTTAENAKPMSKNMRWIFFETLPKILRMKIPEEILNRKDFEKRKEANKKPESYPLVAAAEDFYKRDGSKSDPTTSIEGFEDAHRQISKILNEVRFITTRMHTDDDDEKIAAEWRLAATVLDRFCICFLTLWLVISILFTLIIAPGSLLPIPHSD